MSIAGWHCVEIESRYDPSEDTTGTWTQAREWCMDHFGAIQYTDRWIYAGTGDFRFKEERDAFLFKLRWS